jgi:hypothetical protein
MIPALAHELAALKRQTVAGLRARYAELFGEPTRAGNRAWLVKRIAWPRLLPQGPSGPAIAWIFNPC